MSPGQPQPSGQPHVASEPHDHGTEMANQLQLLRTEMENMRLARENDSSELRRLWDINQSNEQALKQAEAAYKDELLRRQAIEAAHNACCPPAPQRLRPDPTLLTEMARLQFAFASNQHAVNEQILNSLAAANQAFKLKAADIGLFEPAGMPDAVAAILFIDNINDAVKQYGAERVLLVLKRCCNNAVVLSWLTGLDEADRNELLVSIPAWERLLRRDFMPKRSTLEHNARSETFKWSQSRTPSQYVSDKIKLLRIAGIVDPDSVVYEVHRGFDRCPELQIPLIQAVKETGNDISHYRGGVLKYQDMAKLQYEFRVTSLSACSYHDAARSRTTAPPQTDVVSEEGNSRLSDNTRAVKKILDGARLLYEHCVTSKSTPHRCNCSNGFFGTRRMNDNSKRLSTPKPSECRYCGEEFPSRSRLHTHLRTTSHHQRLPPRPSPIIPGASEQDQRAFFGLQTTVDKAGFKTGYEGATLKERGYPLSRPASDSDRDDAGLTSAFTAELPTVPSPLCSSVSLAETETSTTVPSPHCSSVTLAETEASTTVPSPQCSSVTLAETETSTTRTSVPLPLRFSAIPPATSAAHRWAALELRFASLLMGRAMIHRRITRQLIRWQVRPGRLKRRHGMLGIRMFRFCGIQV
jgi:hypothetical protein